MAASKVSKASSTSKSSKDDLQAPLREDVRLLGDMLGETIKEHEGDLFFEKIETIRTLSKDAQSNEHWDELLAYMEKLSDKDLLPVTRAFTHFLNYANIAEQYHRVRRRFAHQQDIDAPAQLGSIKELLPRLLEQGLSQDAIFEGLSTMHTELVLTAHPTEIVRRSLLRKYNDISYILESFDQNNLSPEAGRSQLKRLKRRIVAAWKTDEIRHRRPTPVDEAKWGFATIESTIWKALPDYLREVDNALKTNTGRSLPLEATPLSFAHWMGGDRDGNPNVTAKVTEEVLLLARWQAADLLIRDINELREDLSINHCNATLRHVVGDHPEPYRVLLKELRQGLQNTRAWAEASLKGQPYEEFTYQDNSELLEPLMLIHQSLIDCGMADIADGSLVNVIRRIHCFGLTLLKLDIRQESTRHTLVFDEICTFLNVGPTIGKKGQLYSEWPETEKQKFLLAELENPRPLLPKHFVATEDSQEVLDTFLMLAKQPAEALGAYIISMATSPSDVLAVRLLQKECGCLNPQRIVPLFETLSDLEGAAQAVEKLLSIDWYRKDLNKNMEVMIGYSDSAKDAGFFSASWAQYCAQEDLVKTCQQFGVHLTLFHGRGGSASRGGGPAHAALLSQPPGTINGSVRVTEQGEMIQFKFGLHDIALRNMDLYTSGTLEATLAPPQAPKPQWRQLMSELSDVSKKEYRRIVHDDPQFVPYFRAVTPEQELQRLSLGSRPAKRKASGGVESLRAIPWVFAWTQMRLMLPAWLGTGKALSELSQKHAEKDIKEMSEQWHFFQMLLDMQEMVLAKADFNIAAYYEEHLSEDKALKEFGAVLRTGLHQTTEAITNISKSELLENVPILRRSIDVRNPYVLPLHIAQVELMKRLRALEDGDEPALEQALMVSIAGIAAGLRNTG